MATGIGEDLFEMASWALDKGVWDGRPLSWKEAADFCREAARKVHLLATERPLQVVPVGFSQSAKQFWEDHKVAILVTAAVVAVVATVAIVLLCSAGAATPAVTSGAVAMDALRKQDPPISTKSPNGFSKTFSSSKEGVPSVSFGLESREPSSPLSFPREAIGAGPPPPIPPLGDPLRGTIHYHCGINNTQESVLEAQARMHKTLGGEFRVQPYHVHDDSVLHGLALVGLEKLGVSREVADRLLPAIVPELLLLEQIATGSSYQSADIDSQAKVIAANAEKILKAGNPKLKQVHVTFSHGGSAIKQALERLPPEYRDTAIVIALGTTTILEADLASAVYNIIGEKDWLSQVCNGGQLGLFSKLERAHIELISQEETQAGIGGHYFTQPEYQERIGALIGEIAQEYEIL